MTEHIDPADMPDPEMEFRGNKVGEYAFGVPGLQICTTVVGAALGKDEDDYLMFVGFRLHDPEEEDGHFTTPPFIFSSKAEELMFLDQVARGVVCTCFADQLRHLLESHQNCEHFTWNTAIPYQPTEPCDGASCTGPKDDLQPQTSSHSHGECGGTSELEGGGASTD